MSFPIMLPFPKTRKGAIITMTIVSFVLLVLLFALLLTYLNHQNLLEENGQPDFNTLEVEDLKDNLYVHGKINTIIDVYAERYEKSYGKKKTTDLYYIIPIYDIDANGYVNTKYFISFRTGQKHFDEMDNIVRQTWTDVPKLTTLELDNAVIIDLPDDYKKYLDDWVKDSNFYEGGSFIDWCINTNVLNTTDSETIKSKITPYLIIESTGTDPTTICLFLGFFILSVCLLLYLIFKKGPIKGFEESVKLESFKHIRQMDEDSL